MESELKVPEKVTIEFSCLTKNKLTADLYILLHWKYNNNYKLPNTIYEYLLDDNLALEYLEEEGFIKITADKEFELRQRALDLFEIDSLDKKWLEFLGTFPAKVPSRNGGTRPLKISDPDSKANVKNKNKYITLIKNSPGLHEQIIKVLNAEIKMRTKSGEMQFMNALEAWLNQGNYDKYAYLLEEETKLNYKDEDYM